MNYASRLVRLHDLQMRATAAQYDLWSGDGRVRSTKALADLFFGVTRTLQPDTFVEAGAKTAEVSLRARGLCPAARVVAFEANPYNHQLYSEQFQHEKKSVEYVHSALTDVPGEITFNIVSRRNGADVKRNTGANSILERSDDGVEYERVTVPATTLDAFLNDPGRTVLWVDVEGASQQVLAGAERVLTQADAILIELEDKASWKGQWTSNDAMVYLYERGLTPVARDFEYRSQHNVLFLSDRALNNADIGLNLEYYYSSLVSR
jgi:FkbM family methyltransferase